MRTISGFTTTRLRQALGAVLALAALAAGISAGRRPAAALTLQDLIAPGATVQQVGSGFGFIEGPVWHRDGYLLFSDTPRNQILKWHPTAGLSTYNATIVGPNGLTFDAQNRLVVAEQNARKLERQELNGTIVTLAATYEGKKLNSPNDVAINAAGAIYFTDPPYGLPGGTTGKELTFNGVFRFSSAGALTLLTTEFDRPNGLAFSPDERIIYVADTSRSVVRAFDVLADGTLANSRLFASVTSPDGLKVDELGNVWVAGSGGVWVLDPAGQRLGIISTPEMPANVAFGDGDFKTLYITARTGLYRIRLNVAGIRHYGAGGPPTATPPTPTPPDTSATVVPATTVAPSSTRTSTRTNTTTQPATNLLRNGGFELDANPVDGDPDSWTAHANVVRSSAARRSGTYSIRHQSTTNNGYVIAQVVSGITAGARYSFSGWTSIPATSDAFNYRVELVWRNASNGTISTSPVKSYAAATGGAWDQASGTFTAPPNTTNVVVRMNVSSLNATIYSDDFRLTRGTTTNTPLPSATSTSAPPTPTSTSTTAQSTPTTTRTSTTAPSCGTANIARDKPATSSSNENAGTTPNLAVDGNTGTRWSSAFSDPQWIRVDLGAVQSICRVTLRWEGAYGRSYSVEVSSDNVTWTLVRSTTTGDGGVDDWADLATSGRYVRIYGTQRATPYGYSLWELEVY